MLNDGICFILFFSASILAAVRALEMLAFLLMLSATGWAAFKIFKSPETMHYTKISAVVSFVAGKHYSNGLIKLKNKSPLPSPSTLTALI